ncbi:aminoglycoside phosphotransferase (APT) family kinase protein [Nocardia transvalensis]|uniref:Aminoglycoside phosphotransferase (APT) family kinase protein n=1 Tax=Nocardia transvalensis TaxID=37333 RepID=A0A7W9PLF7_9NOCA|nr:phosphotransferase [Nocardia transvalensis]MBB5917804.1 aminoglycoside phosphotransferase (APT) family kinase protein [Nocardia transvalensis]
MAVTVSLPDGVRDVLAAALGTALTDVELRRFTGGASREVYAIAARDDRGAPVRAVLRRDPPGHGDAARMRAEASCLRAAAAAGVPVPAVLAAADDAPGIDAPYLVMELVTGESIPRRLQRNPEFASVRDRLAGDLGEVLGRIHRTPLDTLGPLDDSDPLDTLEQIYRDLAQPRPVVEMGLRWLRDRPPAARPNALVHGDFRLGNFLVEPDGLRAVLDWELAHIGNPIEDLGWLCVRAWRFGAPAPVGGLGTRDQLLDGYERATGTRPAPDELHWWEVFGTLKWLVLSMFQAERHHSGAERSIELAAIGRRVCESEFDLLTALGLLDDAVTVPTTAEPADTVHDRPAPAEIIELVTETLAAEIGPALTEADQRRRYLLRVCTTLLGTAARELRAGPAAGTEVRRQLAALGCDSEAALAIRLRSGENDYADNEIRRVTTLAVLSRLQVANPRHLG